ncbi:MAG: uroporphyrinogen-III C-methyltransferase [Dehalococcoidia bacterium]|nr:uroporphyrinogen-III C-methyltransferase [Dehalococcoidia bacterium]
MTPGHVFIVGAGPGDPGLVTVAGVRAIGAADVVLYDALSAPALLRHARPGAELVYVGKRAGQHALPQEAIEALIVRRALEGATVCRLKGGDPFVFGRGGEEALACRRARVPFTVVPGVTSAIAAPAYAGVPVTHRDLAASFLVVTGNESGDDGETTIDWHAAARAETLVILMGVATLEANMARLVAAGLDPATPVACVRWGTRPDQEVLRGTVATIADEARRVGLKSPVVTVVGAVATLADELAWFEPGPLAGKRIVVTRARAQASDLAAMLEALGAYVVEAPVITVHPRPENIATDCVSGCWDWIVFTSANGVDAFFQALDGAGLDTRSLGGVKVAAVGEATAGALRARGVRPDFVPSRATSEMLAAELPRVHGARVYLPVSSLTDDRLSQALRKRGAHVDQVAAYENVPEALDAERLRGVLEADAVAFTSASTARNLRAALGDAELPAGARLVSIGAQTSASVREHFGRVDREAVEPTLDALVAAIREVLA